MRSNMADMARQEQEQWQRKPGGQGSNFVRIENALLRLYSENWPADRLFSRPLRDEDIHSGSVILPVATAETAVPSSEPVDSTPAASTSTTTAQAEELRRSCLEAGGGDRAYDGVTDKGEGEESNIAFKGKGGGNMDSGGMEVDETRDVDPKNERQKEGAQAARAGMESNGGEELVAVGVDVCEGSLSEAASMELVTWKINWLELSIPVQLCLVDRMYHMMGLVELFKIPTDTLRRFVVAVEKQYKPNPFHNVAHATSVVHASFMMVKTTRMNRYLRPLDNLALLTAAYCHDIDHPG
ncbi:unnamed protein product [Choristocarpus tenellus]